MAKEICSDCLKNFYEAVNRHADEEKAKGKDFKNNDKFLNEQIPLILAARDKFGLNGLVSGLEAVIINTEIDELESATNEILRYTGHEFRCAFQNNNYRTVVLKTPNVHNSPDILIRSRMQDKNPFKEFNLYPKSKNKPNTRLETFIFKCNNLEDFVAIQKGRGVSFQTDIIKHEKYSFIQTGPSRFTGDSIGFIQWHSDEKSYCQDNAEILNLEFSKPGLPHLKNIGILDHTATRVFAEYRDPAILEFMHLTNYNFQFAIYVESLNSITNVARLSPDDFAMVFTSGISPYHEDIASGPTERFTHNYGPRVHHMAFITENIEQTYQKLKDDGMTYLLELVGSPEDGLKQTFTRMSPNTFIVNEYILRYGDFDGFFTKSNVTELTRATSQQ